MAIALRLKKKGRRTMLRTAVQVGPLLVTLSEHDVTAALEAYRAVISRVTLATPANAPARRRRRVRAVPRSNAARAAPRLALSAEGPTIIDIRPDP
jgi:hypothetical protein